MSYKLGSTSKANLEQCDGRLRLLAMMGIAISDVDFGITEGHRSKERQNELYAEGKSDVQWPNGKHNSFPSKAMDIICYVNGKPTYKMEYYVYIYGLFTAIAKSLKFEIRSGINWDRDGELLTDQSLDDGCHFELV